MKAIKNHTRITACVSRAGSANPSTAAWGYAEYEADHNLPSGYRYISGGPTQWPNAATFARDREYVAHLKSCGRVVVENRPVAGQNAPMIEGMRDVSGRGQWIVAGVDYEEV